jgi:capsular polysaccharide biosynthesis protein
LARGAYGRSIINEQQIVNILKEKYNFIILNGTESLEVTINYFTNAKIMLGAHGSLMKNMIWSKKNPILIELCPPTRHDCFYGNATSLGFTTFFILTNCGEKEEIVLNDEQIENLYKLLDNLM